MADRKLRCLHKATHDSFDQLHRSGLTSKHDAYRWLAGVIGAPLSEAHIGYLGEYYCRLIADESRKLMTRLTAGKYEAAG